MKGISKLRMWLVKVLPVVIATRSIAHFKERKNGTRILILKNAQELPGFSVDKARGYLPGGAGVPH